MPRATGSSGTMCMKNTKVQRGQREGQRQNRKTESPGKADSAFLMVEPHLTRLLVLLGSFCLFVLIDP